MSGACSSNAAPLTRRVESTDVPGALEGLKVVDLTMMLAGPFCTMLLADQGADVVKVEPIAGDGTRRMGPFPTEVGRQTPYGAYFQSINRGKRSIGIDLKSDERQGGTPAARTRRRRADRKLSRRRHGQARSRLRIAARDQSTARLCRDPRLRRPAHRRESRMSTGPRTTSSRRRWAA